MDTLDLSVMKKTAADLNSKGKKPVYTYDLQVNNCQGKVAGVLFGQNYLIQQNALALDVIQFLMVH